MIEFSFYAVWTSFFWSCHNWQPVVVAVHHEKLDWTGPLNTNPSTAGHLQLLPFKLSSFAPYTPTHRPCQPSHLLLLMPRHTSGLFFLFSIFHNLSSDLFFLTHYELTKSIHPLPSPQYAANHSHLTPHYQLSTLCSSNLGISFQFGKDAGPGKDMRGWSWGRTRRTSTR